MTDIYLGRNIGQGSTIRCTEVSDMSQSDSIHRELRDKITLALERQINEQLYQQGTIPREMYEAAKLSLDTASQKGTPNEV